MKAPLSWIKEYVDLPAELGIEEITERLTMLGLKPNYLFSNGGLDANWLDKHGVPTVTIGAGQAEIHTIKEYVNLPEFATGCRLALLLATVED